MKSGQKMFSAMYGSHVSFLMAALTRTSGTIVEYGAGQWSTPLIRRVAGERRVISYEADADWADTMGGCVHAPEAWLQTIPIDTDLVFIDVDSPDRKHYGRAIVAERLKHIGYTGIIVAHDVKPLFPRYKQALDAFRFGVIDRAFVPPTGVYSDAVDVTKWNLNTVVNGEEESR